MTHSTREVFRRDGRVWLRGVLDTEALSRLEAVVDLSSRPGQRLSVSELGHALVPLSEVVVRLLPGARAVRAVGFNKSASSRNWGVPWHQDRVVACSEKAEIPGWQGWTQKAGIWHCEPPVEFLERMVFARVFLDPLGVDNGGMHFAVGSHRAAAVPFDRAEAFAERFPVEIEEAEAGDVLLLQMLTLHRSVPSGGAAPRRVLRIDFAVDTLPPPLDWAL